MRLELVDGSYAAARLGPDEEVPAGLLDPGKEGRVLVAVVRTGEELSIVAPREHLGRPSPNAIGESPGRSPGIGGPLRALRVAGTLDHGLTGVLVALAAPLADAAVPIFALSTWDTDYVLVPEDRLTDALAALEAAGHEILRP